MAKIKPVTAPAAEDAAGGLPAAGGSYTADAAGILQQTDGPAGTGAAARRGFGEAVPTDLSVTET